MLILLIYSEPSYVFVYCFFIYEVQVYAPSSKLQCLCGYPKKDATGFEPMTSELKSSLKSLN